MNKPLNLKKSSIAFGVPILFIGLIIVIAKSSIFETHANNLAAAITFDLLITIPVIYYLLIRKMTILKTSVLFFLIIGLLICSTILPPENHYYLNIFKTWIFPLIELSIISYIIYKLKKVSKSYRLNKKESIDFYSTLKTTCYDILPKKLVMPFVTEIAVFYYGFIHWKKRELKQNEFSYHKESGTITLLIAIIFIVGIETVVIHIMLSKWSNISAWIFTLLSIYSAIQLFGFLKSMPKRPITIENDKLFLRYGIMAETTIDLINIDRVEISSKDIEVNKETRKLSFLGEIESHNIIVHLKKENTLSGLYGIKRTYKNLVLHVDNKIEFAHQLTNVLKQ